ncbi:nuclear GTPase SLIP-GC-like [Parambassis ranga]|uniref:Nuclear GTPase SLIP-GC-like n=1 Tax=Parambassis ranga TaxID=210632 RepID=A0A6P7IVC4_9TELE|nr:nuclear GTPase SLIP-GC-like [Parambassis ranga]
MQPSTSDTAKRKPSLQAGPPARKRQRDTSPGSNSETNTLSDVKSIMGSVHEKLQQCQTTKLNDFMKNKIMALETDKRELVGVFGKTGAGKSSLINAVIGVEDLLPSGDLSACTSVMIKVEANMDNSKYVAEIEFITEKDWENELSFMCRCLQNADQDADDAAAADEDDDDDAAVADEDDDDDAADDDDEFSDKLSALYGEEWEQKLTTYKELLEKKYFKEIPEFSSSQKKTLTAKTAKALSEELIKYTRAKSKHGEGRKEIKRWYWPLVKCVTVKVPKNHLLQHVTLVDLPGNGDDNRSRDKMWKKIIGDCSTVWIVTEINRAASEKEAWEILDGVTSLIGNGGQCQKMHFICTKSDCITKVQDNDIRTALLNRNKRAKMEVTTKFKQKKHTKTHFSDVTFEVFTVSSTEFLQKKNLEPEDTEIPKLQGFLKNLNDHHSLMSNYVSGAYGILSLIQGANRGDGAIKKTEVYTELENTMRSQLCKVRKAIEDAYKAFEKCLDVGVKKSKCSCEKELKSFLYSKKDGRGFHRTLRCVVENGGTHKPKSGAPINLNMKLSSHLTGSIDVKFRKTFPQKTEGKCGPFNGVINSFSLGTERLLKKHKDVELQLTFLKTEENQMKRKLNLVIRDKKKEIYNSLTENVQRTMQTAYDEAKNITGKDSLKRMRNILENHMKESKDTMFKQARDTMLEKLKDLQEEILETLKKTMMESIELSLKTDDHSIPDVSAELVVVKKYYSELCSSTDEEESLTG